MNTSRFESRIGFFGKNGQEKIQNAHVAVVGAGGLGSHVIQQLAFLGTGHLTIIDPDELEEKNLNRLIGVRYDDTIPGTKKVDIAKRLINSINPFIRVDTVPYNLMTEKAFSEIKKSKYVFGCVDNDGCRLVLNELCIAYEIPYIDLASDINPENCLVYGGRVFVNFDDNGCLYCYELISPSNAGIDLSSTEMQKDRETIYGVSREYLGETGPSVVSINGVVASLAVTEFIAMITGLRQPNRLLQYHGHMGIVNITTDKPYLDCYYCKSVRGCHDDADIDRYYKKK